MGVNARGIAGFRLSAAFGVAAFLIVSVPAFGQTALPYALEGIRLGTSLAELRQLDFIEEKPRKSMRLICTKDPEASSIDELQTTELLPPNTERCGVYLKDSNGTWEAAKMPILGEDVTAILMVDLGDAQHVPHLSDIVARLNNSRFQEVLTLLKRTYGPPENYEMSNVDTLYGAVSNATYTWNNGIGSIKVDMLTVALDKMSIQVSEQQTLATSEATAVPNPH